MDNSESDEIHRRRKTMEVDKSQRIYRNGVTAREKSEKSEASNDMMDSACGTHVRKRMERLRNEFVDHIKNHIDDMMSDVINDLEGIDKFDAANARRLDNSEKLYSDKRKTVESGVLPEKVFLRRNSVLTDLYEIQHFRTIYNIFISILIVISLHTVIWDLLHIGSIHLGWNLVTRGFAKISKVIEIWLLMLFSTFVVYRCCCYWAQQRIRVPPKFYRRKLWDFGWLVLFVAYQIALIVLPAQLIISAGLPPVSRVIILTETVRMAMKMHAFVRGVAPIALAHKPHSDEEQSKLPGFSKFLYFMFAPTLVYRQSYPRTKEIRWRFVMWHLFEVTLVIFNMAFIFERYLIPPFEDFGKRPIDVKSFVLKVYGTAFPSILVFLSGFYCLLHAWMNAAAEVTQFGDRLFYKDWWNASGYTSYYRRWNVVVHDWLYTYIYKDLYEIVTPGNRFIPTWTVFFVSSVFHEYIIGVAFSFFFPVMLLQFGVVGFLLIFLRLGKTFGNIFLWFSLCTGSGAMISFYAVEYFARVNCPKNQDNFMDFLLPRSYNCF